MSDEIRNSGARASGEPKAIEDLLPLVYDELRRLAAQRMAQERPGQTLQATALVHEVWLRLAGGDRRFAGRTHFLAVAIEAMRRILIDNARRKQRLKHGGQYERVDLVDVEIPAPMSDDEFLALDEALTRLAAFDARAADVVKLCFFAGLTQEEAARELDVSVSTVERLWSFARAWLFREIQSQKAPSSTH